MKTVFKDNIRSYLLVLILGTAAGACVVLLCELPVSALWAFSYWSSETFGFWMFSTSLIVLHSGKRKTAAFNAGIYVFTMFLTTTVYISFRSYWDGHTPYASMLDLTLHNFDGWLLYSAPPAAVCGVLGAVLWSGRKSSLYGKRLCVLPAVFILAETAWLFYIVLTRHTRLFSAATDLIWLVLYVIFLKRRVERP